MPDDTQHPAPEPSKPSFLSSGLDTTLTTKLTGGPAEPDTAAKKLRAFEDKHLGRKAVRNKEGVVEKGYGSPFKAMTPEQHAEHAALEKLVEAEAKVDAANAELSAAKVAHEAAKQAAVDAAKVSDAAAAEAKRIADEEAKADAAAAH